MQLRTEVSELAGWTVVSLYGELDVATAPSLREQLIELVNDGHTQLVLDLDGIDFLDSTGLGTLIGALRRARTQGGDLRLVCTETRVTRLFEITGLDKAVPLLPSLDAAVAGG
jgi:anti-sigma B factor antagonist